MIHTSSLVFAAIHVLLLLFTGDDQYFITSQVWFGVAFAISAINSTER